MKCPFRLKTHILMGALVPLCLSVSFASPAQRGHFISLSGAITQALKNNNGYKISQEKITESRLRVRGAWGGLWPELSSDAVITRFGADKGIQSYSNGQYDLKFLKCAITLNPGVFYHNLKATQKHYVVAVNEERRIRAETIIQTVRLYYRIILSKEIITLRRKSLAALKENLRVVSARYRVGTSTRLDYLRARVTAANENTRLINARNEYLSAKAAMNIQLGREIDSPLKLNPRALKGTPGEEVKIAVWTSGERKERMKAMVASALKNRPEIIEVRAKKDAFVQGAKAGESLYLWPTLFVKGAYGMNRVDPKDVTGTTGDIHADIALYNIGKLLSPGGWNKNWSVTAGATYRWGGLVPFSREHAKADEMKSRVRQTDLEMEDLLRGIKLEIQQGLLKLVSASSAILSQRENIASAEESLRIAIAQFKNGMIENTKLLDVNVEMASATMMYARALFDLQSAKADLNRAVGEEYFSFKK